MAAHATAGASVGVVIAAATGGAPPGATSEAPVGTDADNNVGEEAARTVSVGDVSASRDAAALEVPGRAPTMTGFTGPVAP